MKQLLSIISFAFCLTSSGQQISQSTNHNRGGDILEKKQVVFEGFCLNGANSVWSLEEADISKKTYQTEYTIWAQICSKKRKTNGKEWNENRNNIL